MLKTMADGEWVKPIYRGFKLECCDCGLKHRVDFRVKNGTIQFRAFRVRRRKKASR